MAGIEIRALTKSYNLDGETLRVLRGVTLSAATGEITVILGKSGCGKTTLLRLVGGLEAPDSGRIAFTGREKTAFVFQEPRLMPWLTVAGNIRFGLRLREREPETVRRIIHTVGLNGFERALPSQLSGGMRQRVALGRALAVSPSFLLMDEPFAALDAFTREGMQKELLRVRDETQAGILFVTHSIGEALLLADRIVLLRDGILSDEISVPFPHPRDNGSQALVHLRREILLSLGNLS